PAAPCAASRRRVRVHEQRAKSLRAGALVGALAKSPLAAPAPVLARSLPILPAGQRERSLGRLASRPPAEIEQARLAVLRRIAPSSLWTTLGHLSHLPAIGRPPSLRAADYPREPPAGPPGCCSAPTFSPAPLLRSASRSAASCSALSSVSGSISRARSWRVRAAKISSAACSPSRSAATLSLRALAACSSASACLRSARAVASSEIGRAHV